MNQIDKNEIIKMIAILSLIVIAVGIATHFQRKSSITLDEYAKNHSHATDSSSESTPLALPPNSDEADSTAHSGDVSSGDRNSNDRIATSTSLTGALLNGGVDGQAMLLERVTYQTDEGLAAENFYYEPLSENLRRYITGVSYPGSYSGETTEDATPVISDIKIDYSDLRYVHVLHYDFDGLTTEGELICNAAIAQDLLDIFYELYRNEYQIEKILLIDEYNGDETASMEDNNTSCFNYRVVDGTTSLSKHALGLALDINPFYNPYVTFNKDGTRQVSPADAEKYANRNAVFPYKIDENDLCYKLFTEHGFIWGGNWNSCKDYQHFQKTP